MLLQTWIVYLQFTKINKCLRIIAFPQWLFVFKERHYAHLFNFNSKIWKFRPPILIKFYFVYIIKRRSRMQSCFIHAWVNYYQAIINDIKSIHVFFLLLRILLTKIFIFFFRISKYNWTSMLHFYRFHMFYN